MPNDGTSARPAARRMSASWVPTTGFACADAERRHHALGHLVGQEYRRLRPHSADVEVDRCHQAALCKRLGVAPDHLDRIGQMEEDQPADDRVVVAVTEPAPNVALDEADVRHACGLAALLRDGQQRRVGIEAGDASVGPYQLGDEERDVPEPAAEVEHALSRAQAGRPQEDPRGLGNRRRLRVEPSDLRRLAAEDVVLFRRHEPPLAASLLRRGLGT